MSVVALMMAGASWAQSGVEPNIVEIQWGDTLSGIAARYTGDLRTWRKLYDAQKSGIPDPNKVQTGWRLELVTEASGGRYLRLMGQGEKASASTLAMPAATAPIASKPAPEPAPAKAAVAKAEPVVPAAAPAASPEKKPVAASTALAATAPRPPPAPANAPVATPVAAVAVAPATDEPLTIGVLPNIAAMDLLAQYDHLKRYLERMGSSKVRIVVPAGFKPFFDSTMRGDYDVAVAAPHFARVAQLERGMIPIAMYEPRINALLIAPSDGSVNSARDLAGKSVAFANPTSLVAMYGVQWLSQQKLEAGKDYQVKPGRTDMGVGRLMLSGESAAAIMSNGEMRTLPADESARMKVVEVFARIPNFILLAHPRLSKERIAQLRNQFQGFLASPEEGAAFGKATGFTGIVGVDESVLKELDPYVAQTRKAMGMGN